MSNVISPAVNLIWPPMLTLFPVSSALFPVKTGICQSACLHDAFQKSNLIEFMTEISIFQCYSTSLNFHLCRKPPHQPAYNGVIWTADKFWTCDPVFVRMHKKGKMSWLLFLDHPALYQLFGMYKLCFNVPSFLFFWFASIIYYFTPGLRQITDPQWWGLNRGHCRLILFLSAFGCWLTGLVWLPETIILTSWNHRPASHPRHISGLLWINCINLMRIYWPALVTFDLCARKPYWAVYLEKWI